MVYQIQKAHHNTFDFEYDGEEFSMPAADSLTYDQAMRVAELTEANDGIGLTKFFQELVEGAAPGLPARMQMSEFTALMRGWKGAGEASLGE